MARPAVKMPLAHLFGEMIKCSVRGTAYILYTIIFKCLYYSMHLFWLVGYGAGGVWWHMAGELCVGEGTAIYLD